MGRYESQDEKGKCVFCKIAKGELETPGVFWEDEKYMAFLSTFPSTEGFTVLIPKKHFGSDVLAMPENNLQEFVLVAKNVSEILTKKLDDVGRVGLIMEGTGIDHAHIKLVPMHGTQHMKEGIWKQYTSDENRFLDKYEGFISSHDGPKANPEELRKLAKQLSS